MRFGRSIWRMTNNQELMTNIINEKAYCNVAAQALGLDPGGYAGHFADAVLIETVLPWKRELYQAAGALPQEAIDLMALWLQRYRETGVYDHRPLLIAPDPVYSQPGYRRVIYYERPSGLFARYTQQEYLIPEEDAGLLLWALFEAKAILPQFDAYRVNLDRAPRDILICTHGTIDVACAKFGYPLYRHLRDTYANDHLRVWRVSHFGGHVFAPTLMDMPTGHYWAYIGDAQAAQLIQRQGDVANLRGHYRGWAGVPDGFAQVAERELWQRRGWAWFDEAKTGEVLAQDSDPEKPTWADVRLTHEPAAGPITTHTLHVEVAQWVETFSTTGHAETYPYAQYAVTAAHCMAHPAPAPTVGKAEQ